MGHKAPSRLAARLGHRFGDRMLLEEALTHKSALPRGRAGGRFGYERLEFLGDRVLGLLAAELLMRRFADEDEGALSKRHSGLVRREALLRVAEAIRLGEHLRLSPGEEAAGGRRAGTMLADACEAVIGALYLDGGLAAARKFFERRWTPIMAEAATPPRDPKTTLQEWAQGRGLPLPDYQAVRRVGPAHAPRFEVSVAVEGAAPVHAEGSSKRAAEQRAAAALLARLAGTGDG